LTLQSTFMNITRNGYNVNEINFSALTNTSVKINSNTVWNAGNDGTGSGLDADLLDGLDSTDYARLSDSNIFTTIPAFNGGTNGASAPFIIDSNFLVTNLNADLLDGLNSLDYAILNGTNIFTAANTFTTIPAFNGGTSGVTPPFTVDSSEVVSGLNADLLDGNTSSYFAGINAPLFTGIPRATTLGAGDNGTALATTAFVNTEVDTSVQTATAWVNFDGTGTVAIGDQYGVSSITDLGTGRYQINFTTTMSNANYAVVGSMSGPDKRNSNIVENLLTTSFEYQSTTNNVGDQDHDVVTAIIFGGL